jgi:hypothetical protein
VQKTSRGAPRDENRCSSADAGEVRVFVSCALALRGRRSAWRARPVLSRVRPLRVIPRGVVPYLKH